MRTDLAIEVYRPHTGSGDVELRRDMLNMLVVMDSLTPIEKSVFVASTQRVFADVPDNELASKMSDTLKWCAKDVGIRDTESADWKMGVVRISQLVKRYYPLFSFYDVRMAFELSATGELNDYFPKDRFGNPDKEHYQVFSADYFCKIMNAYRAFHNRVICKAKDSVPEPETGKKPYTDAELRNMTREDLIDCFLHYKYRGYMPFQTLFGEILLYDKLCEIGFADDVLVCDMDLQTAFQEWMDDLTAKLNMRERREMEYLGMESSAVRSEAIRKKRRKMIRSVFDWMIESEIRLLDYLKFE